MSPIAHSELLLILWWITSHALWNQIYFCISLKHKSASVGLQRPCHVCLGTVHIKKMTIVYVQPHVHVSVRAYSPHNLHHTSHIENDKTVHCWFTICGFFSSTFRCWLILQLTNMGWTVVCTCRLRSLSCFLK